MLRFWLFLLLLVAMFIEKQYAFRPPSVLVPKKRPTIPTFTTTTTTTTTRSRAETTSTPALLTRLSYKRKQTQEKDDQQSSSSFLFDLLASGRASDSRPGNANFFYNDEVVSHLHGYVFLVGLFFAQDPIFLACFLLLAAAAAAATLLQILPANPRVPAVVAAVTLLLTLTVQPVVVSASPVFGIDIAEPGVGMTLARQLECAIVALNVVWGFAGTWRTNEPVNGATRGF